MTEELIQVATGIAPWFLAELARAVALEGARPRDGHAAGGSGRRGRDAAARRRAKRAAFGDRELAGLAGVTTDVAARRAAGRGPRAGLRDGRHVRGEFAAETPYFYSTYAAAGSPPEAPAGASGRPRSSSARGPVRIGQGIEFDYCAVQAADTLRRQGWQAVMINSNPETVSTDFDASSRLYFEPLDPESRALRDRRREPGPARTCSRRSSSSAARRRSNLAAPLAAGGVPLLGADLEAIDQAEERTRFAALLDRLGIPQPEGGMAHSVEEALTLADRIGYPVIVRPSFVIGGLAIDFCVLADGPRRQLAAATVVDPDRPVRIDRYLEGVEVDVDAISDGERGPASRACSSTSSGRACIRATRSGYSRRRPSPNPTRA